MVSATIENNGAEFKSSFVDVVQSGNKMKSKSDCIHLEDHWIQWRPSLYQTCQHSHSSPPALIYERPCDLQNVKQDLDLDINKNR